MVNKKAIALSAAVVVVFGFFGQEVLREMGVEFHNFSPAFVKTPTTDEAWAVFTAYREAAKNHDLAAISQLTYALSPTCAAAQSDPGKLKDCQDLMDSVYLFLKDFKKSDFTHSSASGGEFSLSSDFVKISVESNPVKTTLTFAEIGGALKLKHISFDRY